jgi:phenylacetate-CoA ligase
MDWQPTLRSADPLAAWPAVPSDGAAQLIAQVYQLERSEWLPAALIDERQWRQLEKLAGHAVASLPFYRARLTAAGWQPGQPLTREIWGRLPPLSRQELQAAGPALQIAALPPGHGKAYTISTSGSTGTPVKVLATARTTLLFGAISLRNQRWHRRNLSLKLCTIRDFTKPTDAAEAHRYDYPEGLRTADWTGYVGQIYETGPAAALHIHTPVEQQAAWLVRQSPGHLMTFPSNLMALLRHCQENDLRLPGLRSIWTLGEIMTPELRRLAREVWGVGIADVYSSVEVGYIGLQCPDHEHYHVQSESVLLEVVDEAGRPCAPGEVGRVLVTPLHNFAMPMLRYAIGDHAEVGAACPCGRGLPVVARILGRTRNMLVLPDGGRIWPVLEGALFAEVAPVSQFQVVQHAPAELEVRLVATRPLTDVEEAALRAMVCRHLEHDFAIAFSYHPSLGRGPGGKYEDFVCRVPG